MTKPKTEVKEVATVQIYYAPASPLAGSVSSTAVIGDLRGGKDKSPTPEGCGDDGEERPMWRRGLCTGLAMFAVGGIGLRQALWPTADISSSPYGPHYRVLYSGAAIVHFYAGAAVVSREMKSGGGGLEKMERRCSHDV